MEHINNKLDEINEQKDLIKKEIIQEYKESLENMRQDHNESLEKMRQDHNESLENFRQEYNQSLENIRQEFNQSLENIRQEYNQSFENIRQEIESMRNELNLLPINNNENEISNKLEEVELNEQFKNKEEIKCGICLEIFSIGDKISYLPCFHFFHSSCIKSWIRIKNKCPFCKNIINFS